MDIILIFDVIIVFLGFYLFYAVFWMKKNAKIHSVILAEEEQKRVKDEKGFIEYFSPKLLIFAVLVELDGIFGLITDLFLSFSYSGIIQFGIFFAAFFMFTFYLSKAREKFIK